MTFEEALKLIDTHVFTTIGRRLTSVETIVLKAAWEDERYEQVASRCEYEFNYLRGQVAPKLWMLLSPIIGNGTKVTKKKLRSILEEIAVSPNVQPLDQTAAQENVTIPSSQSQSQFQLPSSSPQSGFIQGQPLDVSSFCGRKAELKQLKQLIASNRCVVLYGPTGVGKSAIAAKLVEDIQVENQPTFDCVIWKSVSYAPPLKSLIADLLKALPRWLFHKPPKALQFSEQDLPESISERTSLLVDFLQKNRCLLILDGAEVWLQGDRNNSFNVYDEKYSEYSIFFRRIIEENHCSCILLTSQEPFKDMIKLQHSGRPSYSLKIAGLDLQDAKAMLHQQGLTNEHKWESLLEPYLGNPAAIKRVAYKIDRFFGGDVANFLSHKTALTSEIYRDILLQGNQLGRLTSLEKQILFYLIEKMIDEPNIKNTFTGLVSDLQAKAATTLSRIMDAVDALDHRSLIVVSKNNETRELLFELPVSLQNYILKEKRVGLLNPSSPEKRTQLLETTSQLFNPSLSTENFAV